MHKDQITEITTLRDLRTEFYKLLTEDSESHDRRKKGFNQAIFIKESGNACFTGTDLEMVMDKIDKAISNVKNKGKTKNATLL